MDLDLNVLKAELWKRWNVRNANVNLDDLITEYKGLELNPKITDKEVQHICAAMNKFGYQTFCSCVGHKNQLPEIYFHCDDSELLKDISYIVKEWAPLNEKWIVELDSASPHLNPDLKLAFILNPEDRHGKFARVSERYDKSVQDLDIIGISMLAYFATFYK